MNAKDFRELVDAALAGLEGDTGPARRMLFELHSQLKAATRSLAEAREAMAASNVRHAPLRDQAEASGAPVDALRQRTTRAAAAPAALGGEVTRLTAEPAIDREQAVRGFKRLVERFGPPAEAREKLAMRSGTDQPLDGGPQP